MDVDKTYTISEYIGIINNTLKNLQAVIIGEVSEVKPASSGHIYFTIKDKDSGDILPCVIWNSNYILCGVELEIGMEIQITGKPEFYGKFGKLSFISNTIELIGDGALKKAYEKLRKKLTAEGLFETSRKRALPLYPTKIAVITSVHGAVIHDFSNNLRRSGFQIKILDSRVEGPESGRSLALSVRALRSEDIDVLVLIRGGGSIQSLAGFDNEALVREIANFPVPVITGIGHHEDAPLATLVADATESTPSLVAALLSKSWKEAEYSLQRTEDHIFGSYDRALQIKERFLDTTFNKAKEALTTIFKKYENAKHAVMREFTKIEIKLSRANQDISNNAEGILKSFKSSMENLRIEYFSKIPKRIKVRYGEMFKIIENQIVQVNRLIETNNPERQLKLGYSIAFNKGKVIRNTKNVNIGDKIEIRVINGKLLSEVKDII